MAADEDSANLVNAIGAEQAPQASKRRLAFLGSCDAAEEAGYGFASTHHHTTSQELK